MAKRRNEFVVQLMDVTIGVHACPIDCQALRVTEPHAGSFRMASPRRQRCDPPIENYFVAFREPKCAARSCMLILCLHSLAITTPSHPSTNTMFLSPIHLLCNDSQDTNRLNMAIFEWIHPYQRRWARYECDLGKRLQIKPIT